MVIGSRQDYAYFCAKFIFFHIKVYIKIDAAFIPGMVVWSWHEDVAHRMPRQTPDHRLVRLVDGAHLAILANNWTTTIIIHKPWIRYYKCVLQWTFVNRNSSGPWKLVPINRRFRLTVGLLFNSSEKNRPKVLFICISYLWLHHRHLQRSSIR